MHSQEARVSDVGASVSSNQDWTLCGAWEEALVCYARTNARREAWTADTIGIGEPLTLASNPQPLLFFAPGTSAAVSAGVGGLARSAAGVLDADLSSCFWL
jgi:hypothetical protein